MICMYNDKDDNSGDNDAKDHLYESSIIWFLSRLKKKMKLIEYTDLLTTVSWIG